MNGYTQQLKYLQELSNNNYEFIVYRLLVQQLYIGFQRLMLQICIVCACVKYFYLK